jgi:hypothetical protein
MRPEVAKRLARAFPGLTIPVTGVDGVAGVADVSRYARKPQQLRQLRPIRLEIEERKNDAKEGVAASVAEPLDAEVEAIEERAAIVCETCPAPYVDTFAGLNHQKPFAVSDAEWRLALDDAGRFLDDWGADAADMQWSPGDLFDVPRPGRPGGLVWRLRGERVESLGWDHARLSDGRILKQVEGEA